jgi:sulfane dehydrogenase subunit SoxC
MTRKTNRRGLLKAGMLGAMVPVAVRADNLVTPAMTTPAPPGAPYGAPDPHEADVKRLATPLAPQISPGTSSSRTPLRKLEGIITPSGLHYERHHAGVPQIDPATHRLLLHGLVERPLEFSVPALLRYPRVSRIAFLECGGNSGANAAASPPQTSVDLIHGLVSCSEWTGVPVKLLLDEAGIRPDAAWIVAEGGDAASMARSLPLKPVYEQGLLALFQNGERLRPEQGYPVRLFMPGWEGNLNIKWLQRLKLVKEPVFTREETSKYTQLQPDGIARQFDFIMPVKSVIVAPSVGMTLKPGYQEVTGLAWSGHGAVRSVEITADGGRHWQKAELSDPILPQCLTRFRLEWAWDGKPALLQSRAGDSAGNHQPSHAAWVARFAPGQGYHYNAIQSWRVEADGKVHNIYA